MILCSIGPLLPLLHLLEILYYNFKQILIKREKGIWGEGGREREVGEEGGMRVPTTALSRWQCSWVTRWGTSETIAVVWMWFQWGKGCFRFEYVGIWLLGKWLRRMSKQTSFNGIGMCSNENTLQRAEPNTSVACDKEKSVEVQSSRVNMARKAGRGARQHESLHVKCMEVMQR
jgi:hypothetical protein